MDQFDGHNFKRSLPSTSYDAKGGLRVSSLFTVNYIEDGSYTQLENDYICRGTILDGVNSNLFDVYWNYQTAQKLWKAIQARFITEDVGNGSYLINKFIEFKIVDNKPILEQV